MKSQKIVAILLLALVQFACTSMPRLIWREVDIKPSLPAENSPPSILIASRQSEFKAAVIETVAINYQTTNIAVKIVGLEALESENPADYQAVVLINTCMAWKIDPAVESFLKRYPAADNLIVLTTSGDGEWLPKKPIGQYDAVSAASVMADVGKTAAKIIQKINAKIK